MMIRLCCNNLFRFLYYDDQVILWLISLLWWSSHVITYITPMMIRSFVTYFTAMMIRSFNKLISLPMIKSLLDISSKTLTMVSWCLLCCFMRECRSIQGILCRISSSVHRCFMLVHWLVYCIVPRGPRHAKPWEYLILSHAVKQSNISALALAGRLWNPEQIFHMRIELLSVCWR